MKQVDFYIIQGDNEIARMQICCRLLEKAYQNRSKTLVYCNDKVSAERIDELLWTFKDDSFIPHNLCGEVPNPPPPVQIGHGDATCPHRDILINLSSVIPENHSKYKRIIEIVSQADDSKLIGREHFKFYREQGYILNSHDLTTK